MKLTPIKVKGKAGQKKIWQPPPPPQRTTIKRPREDEDESGSASDHGRSRRRFKSKKPPAPVEELPTEILERIIFLSRNLNSLRASLRIGYRFSSPSFLTELLEAAFAPTWETAHTFEGSYVWGPPTKPDVPVFQSAVLACEWATATLILEARQKWCRRRAARGEQDKMDPRFEYAIGPVIHDSNYGNGYPGLARAEDVAPLYERDWQALKDRCAALLSGEAGNGPPTVDQISFKPNGDRYHLEVHPDTKLPNRLLAGPFDWEKARTLCWIVRAGAPGWQLDEGSWELTKQGYDQLMVLPDHHLALVCLLLLARAHAFIHWPRHLVEQELDGAAREAEKCSDNPAARRLWRCAALVVDAPDEFYGD